jgi:hypothetical protein
MRSVPITEVIGSANRRGSDSFGQWLGLGVVGVADDEGGREFVEWVLGEGFLIRAGARCQVIKQGQESQSGCLRGSEWRTVLAVGGPFFLTKVLPPSSRRDFRPMKETVVSCHPKRFFRILFWRKDVA